MIKVHKLLTNNSHCYDKSHLRNLKSVKFIAIHYTGNDGDSAWANANYFAHGDLQRNAGAHFFVDGAGKVYKSIPMERTAYAVGTNSPSKSNGGAKLYGTCTNSNSVSIELCDARKKITRKQAKATRQLVKRIRKYCPNAQNICRHWDVTGKECPVPFVGSDNKKWKIFKALLVGGSFTKQWKKLKKLF